MKVTHNKNHLQIRIISKSVKCARRQACLLANPRHIHNLYHGERDATFIIG
jgi:hypothetical protein